MTGLIHDEPDGGRFLEECHSSSNKRAVTVEFILLCICLCRVIISKSLAMLFVYLARQSFAIEGDGPMFWKCCWARP